MFQRCPFVLLSLFARFLDDYNQKELARRKIHFECRPISTSIASLANNLSLPQVSAYPVFAVRGPDEPLRGECLLSAHGAFQICDHLLDCFLPYKFVQNKLNARCRTRTCGPRCVKAMLYQLS